MKKFSFIFLLLCLTAIGYSQSSITGKITDSQTKEPITGAIVRIAGTSKAVFSDFDGNFTLGNLTKGTYTLEVSYISYLNKIIPGIAVSGDSTSPSVIDVNLDSDSKQLTEVNVVETKITNTENAAVMEMKKNTSIVNTMSATQIQKSQDRDAADVVRRVPGVSIIDNRFIMVRGLSDRYNTVWLNDAGAPSSEVDKKSFSFDMVTSGMIDRMLIYKTASPELPGDFSGGMVKIYTTAMPQKTGFNASYNASYRPGSTGTDYYHTKIYKNDWLGNGYKDRALPSEVPSYIDPTNTPTVTLSSISKSFNNDWIISKSKTNPDQRLNIGFNGLIKRPNLMFGSVTALNYANTWQTLEIHRQSWDSAKQQSDYADVQSTNIARVSAMQNFALLFKNQKIEFRNLYNQLGRSQTTMRNSNFLDGPNENTYAMLYDDRKTLSSQLSGTHPLFKGKTEYSWTAGYAYNRKDLPDYRRITYTKQRIQPDSMYYTSIPSGAANITNGGRFYSNLIEKVKSFNHNIKQTIKIKNYTFELNAGNYFEFKDRSFVAREFGYTLVVKNYESFMLKFLPLDQIFSQQHVGVPGGFQVNEATASYDKYNAQNKLIASYLAGSFPIGKHIKLQGGARYEYNVQSLQSHVNQDSIHPSITTKYWLPSFNGSYSFLNDKHIIRGSYSKTLNRPEFREWAPLYFYDFEFNVGTYGSLYPSVINPTGAPLSVCEINNYDVRYEFYPSIGEYIQIGAFQKTFKNPIQQVILNSGGGDSRAFTFVNADDATVQGIEIDVRKSLGFLAKGEKTKNILNMFSLVGNASFMRSQMHISKVINQTTTTPLQGQSPYLANFGLYFQNEKSGTQASLLFNVFGSRIVFLGTLDDASIGEMSRKTLDFSVSQRIYKFVYVTFAAQNILNAAYRYVQDTNRDNKFNISKGDKEVMYYQMGAYYSAGIKINF